MKLPERAFPFVKMHGIGNDFVMLDCVRDLDATTLSSASLSWSEISKDMTDRRKGIGGDGLILVEKGDEAPFRMRMFNPDGSESEMCGNGIRCFAKLIKDRGYLDGSSADVETGAGRLTVELTADGQVRVNMGKARLATREIPMVDGNDDTFIEQPLEVDEWKGTAVSMGNPHLVLFVNDVQSVDLERLGPLFEHHPKFPRRTNVHFIEVVDSTHLIQRTWERGAGITLACGTGACASAVAAFLTDRASRDVVIDLPGGRLRIEYGEDGIVHMTGPAVTVFEGEWPR